MTQQWIVLMRDTPCAYGPPFDDEALAEHFADYLTTEVDPAIVVPLRSAVAELLAWHRQRTSTDTDLPPRGKPDGWPPKPGEVWQDRDGCRWIATRTSGHPYLTCLARQADDSADEIWRLSGPMTLVQSIAVEDEEPPF